MKYWRILEFSKEIGKHKNTVDGWFSDLEDQQIHFVNRNENNIKIYDELDLEIANFIVEKRKNKQYTLQGCYDEIKLDFKDRLRPPVVKEKNETTTLTTLDELKSEFSDLMNSEMDKRINELLEKRAAQILEQKVQMFLPNPEKERIKEKDSMITKWRIERNLREKAHSKWNTLPEEQRTKKAGFLGLKRVEDIEKKQQFIQQYIDDHFEAYVEHEYGVQEDSITDTKASNE